MHVQNTRLGPSRTLSVRTPACVPAGAERGWSTRSAACTASSSAARLCPSLGSSEAACWAALARGAAACRPHMAVPLHVGHVLEEGDDHGEEQHERGGKGDGACDGGRRRPQRQLHVEEEPQLHQDGPAGGVGWRVCVWVCACVVVGVRGVYRVAAGSRRCPSSCPCTRCRHDPTGAAARRAAPRWTPPALAAGTPAGPRPQQRVRGGPGRLSLLQAPGPRPRPAPPDGQDAACRQHGAALPPQEGQVGGVGNAQRQAAAQRSQQRRRSGGGANGQRGGAAGGHDRAPRAQGKVARGQRQVRLVDAVDLNIVQLQYDKRWQGESVLAEGGRRRVRSSALMRLTMCGHTCACACHRHVSTQVAVHNETSQRWSRSQAGLRPPG